MIPINDNETECFLRGAMMWLHRWIRSKADDEAATSVTQQVMDLTLGEILRLGRHYVVFRCDQRNERCVGCKRTINSTTAI